MTFQEYSKNSREKMVENFRTFFEEVKKEEVPKGLHKQKIVDVLEDFVSKGKLLRGTLFLLTAELLGGKITKELLNIACGIELVHSGLLIQDDIIDRDRTRRGGESVFVHYENEGKDLHLSDLYHYGISIAIVASDAAFFLANELFSSSSTNKLPDLVRFYSHEIYLVALAEGLDSELGQSKSEPSKDDIYTVYKYKTARYTFVLPFTIACIVTDTTNENKVILEQIGEAAGTVFQIKDDVIGLLGDEQTIGKPVGSDIRENKKTLIRSLLYERAGKAEQEELDRAFGNSELTSEQIERVKQLCGLYGVEKEMNANMEKIMEKVWELIKELRGEAQYLATLNEFLEFNIKRSY